MTVLTLPPHASELLAKERDAHAASLARRAAEVQALTPLEYLRRGIYVPGTLSYELAGRLAKSGWSSLAWDESKGSWRVQYASYSGESHVRDADVLLMLGDPQEPVDIET